MSNINNTLDDQKDTTPKCWVNCPQEESWTKEEAEAIATALSKVKFINQIDLFRDKNNEIRIAFTKK